MKISTLGLSNFRSHSNTTIEFAAKVNVIGGFNGAGKTNILEAIHYLCLSKNFLSTKDRDAVRFGESEFTITGDFTDCGAADARVVVQYGGRKEISVNGVRNARSQDLIGRFPVVIFHPGDMRLTLEGPAERRRFINNTLCQEQPAYLAELVAYRRLLKQRNSLLQQHRHSGREAARAALHSWNNELATKGARIIYRRNTFVAEFALSLQRAYSFLEEFAEEPGLKYRTIDATLDSDQAIAAALLDRLDQNIENELRRGVTLTGPHRDELQFMLGGIDLRRFASQGQHRSFSMALKLAQFFHMRDRFEHSPLLLLDDVFQHLDDIRTKGFLSLLSSKEVGQCIIASASTNRLSEYVDFSNENNRLFAVEDGMVVDAERLTEKQETHAESA